VANSAQAYRRWWGTCCLILAAGMVVWGQTLLKPHLKGWGYLVYWLVCFGFTLAAIVVALVDAVAIRYSTRREHLDLLQQTLHDIEAEGGEPTQFPKPPPPKPPEP
jgi:hypothetical protein